MPPGGARRFVRPILASQVVGKSLRLWFTSLPQVMVVTAIAGLPFIALRWYLHEQTGWKASVETSIPAIQLLAVTAVGQAFAIRFIFQRLRGEPIELARSISVGARRIGTVLAIALLLALPQLAYLAANNFLLTQVQQHDRRAVQTTGPELLLALATYAVFELVVVLVYPVAAPAAVVEGEGIVASLRRSAALTKGRRATIFGIVILFGLLWMVPFSVLLFVLFGLHGNTQFFTRSALELFFASLHCVTPVVLYHELRDTKEGFGIEDLATVFE